MAAPAFSTPERPAAVAEPAAAPFTQPSAPAVASAQKRSYRKLPGRMANLRLGNYGQRRLYLGDDHLLQVESVFCVEHYRRFVYADIQALLLRRTPRGLVTSVVLTVLAAVCGGLAWYCLDNEAALVFWLIVAGVFGFFLLINLALGTTCRCQLQTAIGPQPLLSLNRMRPARRALALLSERIQATQGTLPPDAAASQVDERLSRGR